MSSKTRVWQDHKKVWWCEYYMPYSGCLIVECDSWASAMREACAVERMRPWA